LQPDSLVPDPSNPQAWNWYSYVTNNPILYNDPTGHKEDCGFGEDCQVGHDNPNDPDPVSNGGGGGNNDDDDGDGSITVPNNIIPTYINDTPPSPIDYLMPVLPTGEEMCRFVFSGSGTEDIMCRSGARKSFEGLNLWPDYYTFQVGVGAPILPIPPPFGATGVVTYSNGHVFIAGGGNLGKTFSFTTLTGSPVSFNASAGWIIVPHGRATSQQALNFLHGTAVNISVGPILGGGVNINSSGMAFEAGIYTPQVGGSVTHTVLDINLTTNDWDLFP